MASQGGKGKQSSQSDKNYWARLKAQGGISKRKAGKIAAAKKRKQGIIDYGRPPMKFDPPRTVFTQTPRENFPAHYEATGGVYGHAHIVVLEGITVEVCERETDALAYFNANRRRLAGYVSRVSPSGTRVLIREISR